MMQLTQSICQKKVMLKTSHKISIWSHRFKTLATFTSHKSTVWEQSPSWLFWFTTRFLRRSREVSSESMYFLWYRASWLQESLSDRLKREDFRSKTFTADELSASTPSWFSHSHLDCTWSVTFTKTTLDGSAWIHSTHLWCSPQTFKSSSTKKLTSTEIPGTTVSYTFGL